MRPSPLVHEMDAVLFAPEELERLRGALHELSWLLSRGYSATAALKLVGDRHALAARQRDALSRCACSDSARERRRAHEVPPEAMPGSTLLVDGYNVLTTLRVALAGGLVLQGRDGCLRDLAGVRGRHHDLPHTAALLDNVGRVAGRLGLRACHWYFERRVPRSAELAHELREAASAHGWQWSAHLVGDADALLLQSQGQVVASSDSRILDQCERWFNLTAHALPACAPTAWRIELA